MDFQSQWPAGRSRPLQIRQTSTSRSRGSVSTPKQVRKLQTTRPSLSLTRTAPTCRHRLTDCPAPLTCCCGRLWRRGGVCPLPSSRRPERRAYRSGAADAWEACPAKCGLRGSRLSGLARAMGLPTVRGRALRQVCAGACLRSPPLQPRASDCRKPGGPLHSLLRLRCVCASPTPPATSSVASGAQIWRRGDGE